MARKRKRRTPRRRRRPDHRSDARPSPPPTAARSAGQRAWRQFSPLLWGLALALVIRAFVIETFYVPSESMLPTLLVGDHVIVNKFAYGARIPFTDLHLPALREPERGDVVIFALGMAPDGGICPLDRCPELRPEGFVKRIVGLPGDSVAVSGGTVVVNGEPVAVTYGGDVHDDDAGQSFRVGRETLGGRSHPVLDHPRFVGLALPETEVPEDHYFVMGDNRDKSNDSRGWGPVARNDLKGPVTFIYWSWNNRGSWLSMLNPLTWVRLLAGETRWSRFGTRVD
ncbi:MAG: signal peptidase I [Myxococcales bacterium]|nr:signal peptidase I [Myxococcales bacterium]